MENLENIKKDEIFSYTNERLRELEADLRLQIAKSRVEKFGQAMTSSANVRKLKKNLVRVLTRKTELKSQVSQ